MIILLFVFIAASQALHLKKSLGDIYLSQNEVYELSLSDFFAGNNLTYQISSPNSESNEISLENKMNFELLSFNPYPPQSNKYLATSSGQKTYTILNYLLDQIVCDFYEDNIYLYKLTEKSNDLLLIWYGQIKTEYKFAYIKSIEGLWNYYRTYFFLLIQMQQQENIDDNLVWRNDFYIMNLTDISAIKEPILANLSHLTYASNIIMSPWENRYIVYIYGEFPDNKNAIFLYNFTNPYSPIYIQAITQYFVTPKEIQTLSVKSMLASPNFLILLDSNIGIIVYSCKSRIFCIEKSFIDLRSAGNLQSMWFLYDSSLTKEAINVLTDKGNILIRTCGDLKQWIPSYKNNGLIYNPTFLQYFDNFYFIQYEISDKSILNIYENKNFENALYQIDIGKMIGKHYNKNGFWTIIHKFSTKSILYLRSDFDGIRHFEIKINPYSLKVKGNSNFKAEIIAYENNNGNINSLSSIINVITIPANTNEIYLLNDYRSVKISPQNILVEGYKSSIFLYPINYFSGPNLNFTVTTHDSEFFTFESSQIEKLKFIKNQTLPDNIEWVENSDGLIYYFKDHIIVNDIFINIANPIKAIRIGTDIIIYWKTAELSPMITFYRYSEKIITQSWELASECKIFKLNKLGYGFICSDGEIIEIYNQNEEGFWTRVKLISGNNFEGNFTWNLADIEDCAFAPSEPLNNYLYLADKVKGLLVIDLLNLSSFPSPYFISESSLTGILKIFSTKNAVILLLENFSINIFANPLSYIRTIQLENSGTFTRAELIGNMLLLQFEETLFAIKANEPAQNALYFEKKIGSQGYFSLNNYWTSNEGYNELRLYFFYLNSTEKYYETYLAHFLDYIKGSLKTIFSDETLSIEVKNPQKLVEEIYPAEVTITANNNFRYSSISLPLNIIVSGLFVWFEPCNWNIKETISYDEEYEFNLNDAFFGRNLDFSLNINGKYLNNSEVSTLPAIITPKIEIIHSYNSPTTLYHQALIPNTDIRVITASEGFIILNSSDFQKTLYYSSYSFNNIKCDLIDTVNFTKNNSALLVTSCNYQINGFSNIQNGSSKINILALWEFDYISFTVNIFNFLTISYSPSYIKIIALNDTDFEIMTAQQCPEYLMMQMLHFRGKWIANRIDIKQLTSIDAISLNMPSFNSWFFDGFSENSENSVWFILEKSYGIRILKVSSNGLEILDGIPNDMHDHYFSIGLCGDYLYALKSSNILQKILIKDLNNLEIIETFYSNHNWSPRFTRLSCSDDGKYIGVLQSFTSSTQFLRIYDTSAKNSSFILADIEICDCSQFIYVYEYVFVNLNTISIIECAPGRNVTTFKINPNILKIPKLNESEYEKIIEEWGTNIFDIFITAKNENNEVNSSIVKFVRVITEKYLESQDKEHWLIWVIAATAVMIIGAISFILMKNMMLKKKDKSLENQTLVLMTIKENQI